jgi:luciferase family oxidoreductase group 1
MLPLSVLDLSFVVSGVPPAVSLHNTIDLARFADELGYKRYWLAEHHNLPSVASPAPEIMIGQVAAVTKRLRVGSGGVMLPNHAPLMVAERFKMLEALFPGRIDLGVGRAPGTDPVTTFALRRRQEPETDDDFLQRLQELVLFETGGFPERHPFRTIAAMPTGVMLPPIWLLGSSDYSSQLSAAAGMGFAFAHHFASYDAQMALLTYRERFKPSVWLAVPQAILAIAAICAETEQEAERLASSARLNSVRRAHGEYRPIPSPEEAAAYQYSASDIETIRRSGNRLFVGTPATLKEKILAFVDATQADEVMITSAIHDHQARRRSYELLADAFGLERLPGNS